MPVNLLDKISFSLKEGLVFKLSRVLLHRGPYQHRCLTTVLPLLTPTPSLWDTGLVIKASTSLTTREKLFARSVSLSDDVVIVFFSFQVPLYLPFHIYTREAVRYRWTLSGVARWPRAGLFVIAWHIGFDSLLSFFI